MHKEISLAGRWLMAFDPEDGGRGQGWTSAPPACAIDCPVPSCWNSLFPERRTYDGAAWYYTSFFAPEDWAGRRLVLRFEGVNYRAEAWLGGRPLGSHEGGFTPFEFELSQAAAYGSKNLLAIRVDGRHDESTFPAPGVDWFNYNGIYRPVSLHLTEDVWIADYRIRARQDRRLRLSVELGGDEAAAAASSLLVRVLDREGAPVAETALAGPDLVRPGAAPDGGGPREGSGGGLEARFELDLPGARLWRLLDPYLYVLELEVHDAEGEACDAARKEFGFRSVSTSGCRILLNGEEVRLAGCSKHDEYPLGGRTVGSEWLVTEYELYRSTNANAVRLCHYPHDRRELEVLNGLGIAAIAEIPLVFLHERQLTDPEALERAKRLFDEAFHRDKNETCILFWSLFVECDTHLPAARPFVEALVRHVRALDDSRLLVTASIRPLEDLSYELYDVVGVNYWEGWYRGQSIEGAAELFSRMALRYPDKPLLVTSHGWEGIYGLRSPDEKVYWSEELQAEYLRSMAQLLIRLRNVAGEIVWTFADFRVSRWEDGAHPTLHRLRYLERPGETNNKGLVDFYRRKKASFEAMAGCFQRWTSLAEQLADRGSSETAESSELAFAFRLIDAAMDEARSGRSVGIELPEAALEGELGRILAENGGLLEAFGISVGALISDEARAARSCLLIVSASNTVSSHIGWMWNRKKMYT